MWNTSLWFVLSFLCSCKQISLDFICSPVCCCIKIWVHWGSMDRETSACAAKPLFHKDTLPHPQKEVLKPNGTSCHSSQMFSDTRCVFSFGNQNMPRLSILISALNCWRSLVVRFAKAWWRTSWFLMKNDDGIQDRRHYQEGPKGWKRLIDHEAYPTFLFKILPGRYVSM